MFCRCPLQDAEMSINLKSGLPLVLKQLNNVSPEHGMWYLTNCYCTLNTCKFIINYQKFRGLGSIYGINLWFRSSSSLLIRENIGSRLSWHWYALCVNLVSQGAIWSHIFWSVTQQLWNSEKDLIAPDGFRDLWAINMSPWIPGIAKKGSILAKRPSLHSLITLVKRCVSLL